MYRAQDVVDSGWIGATFKDLAPRLGDELFDPATGRGRYILYNVGPLASRGKFDVICFGETAASADEGIEALYDLLKRG